DRGDLLPDTALVVDQQDLIDVELAAEPAPLRAVDRDGVLVIGERPAQRAQVRAVREPPGLPAEIEDAVAPAVLLRDGDGAVPAPRGLVGDHADQRARIAAMEGGEDAIDPREGVSVQEAPSSARTPRAASGRAPPPHGDPTRRAPARACGSCSRAPFPC